MSRREMLMVEYDKAIAKVRNMISENEIIIDRLNVECPKIDVNEIEINETV